MSDFTKKLRVIMIDKRSKAATNELIIEALRLVGREVKNRNTIYSAKSEINKDGLFIRKRFRGKFTYFLKELLSSTEINNITKKISRRDIIDFVDKNRSKLTNTEISDILDITRAELKKILIELRRDDKYSTIIKLMEKGYSVEEARNEIGISQEFAYRLLAGSPYIKYKKSKKFTDTEISLAKSVYKKYKENYSPFKIPSVEEFYSIRILREKEL